MKNQTFAPQETSLNSFQEVETNVNARFVEMGYPKDLSKAIAHTFTQFMLGYVSAEGVAQLLMRNGADPETAVGLGELFREIRDNAGHEESTDSEPAFEMN